MDNEKSVYEILQEQIERQDKIISNLMKINIILTFVLAIIMCIFTISYFWSDYDYGTHIIGDSNKTVENSELNNSELDIK